MPEEATFTVHLEASATVTPARPPAEDIPDPDEPPEAEE